MKKMPKYKVLLYTQAYKEFYVEAEDAEEAGELAWSGDAEQVGEITFNDAWELDEIQEIED
jgi:hypothetical protein